MAHGLITPSSHGGWAYIADIGNFPSDGIITPENLSTSLTAVGGWEFAGFESSDGLQRFSIGYAYNAINKMLWSAANSWRSTLQLRLAADYSAGGEATPNALKTLAMCDSPEEIVESMSKVP